MHFVTKYVTFGSSLAAMTERICPRCGRNDVRLSGRRHLVDHFLACFGLKPFRCRACRNRFYRFTIGPGKGAESTVIPINAVTVVAEPSDDTWPLHENPLSKIPVARSLLIVSRDPAVRKLLCRLLSQPTYHTHQLSDSGQLSSELRARKVDVLIIDLDLPEQQALEAVAGLRSQYPNLKIIALSGLRVGGVPGSVILPKPFRKELLLESVQNALLDAADVQPLEESAKA